MLASAAGDDEDVLDCMSWTSCSGSYLLECTWANVSHNMVTSCILSFSLRTIKYLNIFADRWVESKTRYLNILTPSLCSLYYLSIALWGLINQKTKEVLQSQRESCIRAQINYLCLLCRLQSCTHRQHQLYFIPILKALKENNIAYHHHFLYC